jgi:hypothetical protein
MNVLHAHKFTISIAFLVVVGAAIAVLVMWNRPDGRAEAADVRPTTNLQVSISKDDLTTLADLRQQVQSEPHTIDPTLNKRILNGELDSIIQGPLSASQRAILADGVITFDEYRTAQSAWRTCAVDAGLSVPPLHLNGLALYNDVSISGGTDRQAMDTAVHTCTVEYTGAIRVVWSGVTGELVKQLAQVETSVLQHCLAGANVSPSEAKDVNNLSARKAYGDCIDAITLATDTTAFYGNL